jgi:hypothetical protein
VRRSAQEKTEVRQRSTVTDEDGGDDFARLEGARRRPVRREEQRRCGKLTGDEARVRRVTCGA